MTAGSPHLIDGSPPGDVRIRIAVVADSVAEREKLSAIIGASQRFLLVGSYCAEDAAWADCDVIVGYADSDDAFDMFYQLADRAKPIPSLVVVSSLERLDLQRTKGAVDVIAELARLSRHAVLKGLDRISDAYQVTGISVADARSEDRRKLNTLTDREREVLALTAEGLSIKSIAARLGRSYGTVAAHRGALMDKLRIHDKVGLTRFAIRMHLIDP